MIYIIPNLHIYGGGPYQSTAEGELQCIYLSSDMAIHWASNAPPQPSLFP